MHCSSIFYNRKQVFIFIHSGHFYSAPSRTLLLRGAPDYRTDTVSEFHAEAHRQLQVKDLPKVLTWRIERESKPTTLRLRVIASTNAPPCPTMYLLFDQRLGTLFQNNNGDSFSPVC